MRRRSIVVGAATLGLALPAPAGAATNLGEAFLPVPSCNFATQTYIQSTSPASPSYVVPSAGVITSFSVGAGAAAPTEVRLKLAVPAGGNNFTIVRQSPTRNGPAPNTIATYNARERVAAGELLGLYLAGGADCARPVLPPFKLHNVAGDQLTGTTTMYTAQPGNDQIPIAAVLEPDADGDGYGDETQDCAPTDPSRAEDCVPPDTQISQRPKNKTKKKRATFAFSGVDTGSVDPITVFECSLDGAEFVPCFSPFSARVKKGRHDFAVRSADAAGNLDATPATDSWKVKKKKKRKKKRG